MNNTSIIYRRLLTITGVISVLSFLLCFALNSDPLVPGYAILPLVYAITRLISGKIYKVEMGLGLILFETVAFLRYVVTPLITCIVRDYDGYVWATSHEYGAAVIYMAIELIMAYFVMWFMIPMTRKTRKRGIEEDNSGRFGIIKILIVAFFIYILLRTPLLREMLFNFSISTTDIDPNYLLSNYRSQIDGSYIVFYYVGLIVIYVELLNITKQKKSIPNNVKIFLICILSLAYMSCGWSNGRNVSRWSLLAAVLLMIYVLQFYYPERKKSIIGGGAIVLAIILLIGTFYKRIAQGMDLDPFEALQTYLTPKALNEYFGGVFPVGNGLRAVREWNGNKFTTFLYDTVATIPKFLKTLRIEGTSTATYYGSFFSHIELIMPTVSMSYAIFGMFGTSIYTMICVFFMILCQNKMNNSSTLYSKVLYIQIVFWCSLVMAVNIQIIQANVWKYVVGLILIALDNKIRISAMNRRRIVNG